MVNITKLKVDVDNEQLLISATSKGETTDNATYHHRFTKVFIDTTTTFNCYNEPSSYATTIDIPLPEDSDSGIDYDKDLEDYAIPFSDILCDDIANDVLFVWLEEVEYDNLNPLHVRDMPASSDYTNPDYGFGVTLSVATFYNLLLENLKIKSEDCCDTDCSDVNMMIAWQGFNLAKTLGEYKQMIYYWKLLHNVISDISTGCNCN